MNNYNPKEIEPKWQKFWEEKGGGKAQDFSDKEKLYLLVEFPYPSGDGLHVGHCRSYTALDILARKKRMDGKNVLFPIGWDAFGLPTENYAIKNKIHPCVATEKNIVNFRRQLKAMGFSFDWDREVDTTDPAYYKWTQWIFLQLYKKGLAYKEAMPINWCPSCKIGLANEEVLNGKCERCGASTEKRDIKQWILKITEYAGRLLSDLDNVDYLEKIKSQQQNWIGKSEGAEIIFKTKDLNKIGVFTTRPDTLFGVTYLVLAPEHPLVESIITKEQKYDVDHYVNEAKNKRDIERTDLTKEKTGVFTGAFAINPATGEEIPVWVADYVLAHYGSGAIMSVPAHDERDFEFAKKFNLPIKVVIIPGDRNEHKEEVIREYIEYKGVKCETIEDEVRCADNYIAQKAYTGTGYLFNSGDFTGRYSQDAKVEIVLALEKEGEAREVVTYKLRDWIFSRQHYWGEPIPIVLCEKCGEVPVLEEDLPLELPDVENYEPTDTGESPLAAMEDWVNTTCPKCGGAAKRETDTMPNWAGSSWYFLRYIDPKNSESFADIRKLKYWLPIDLYNGGMEHTTLHLLYSRFWHKFLYDIEAVPTKEPYQKRISHGMVLGEGGVKMSKSKGNVVNPDDVIEKYGADALRLYEMFMGPFEQQIPWDTKGMEGVNRFLHRVWCIFNGKEIVSKEGSDDIKRLLHKTIKKVTDDIESFNFNTAISQMMIFVNELQKEENISNETVDNFIRIIAPFAPHIAEELWQILGFEKSVFLQSWPQANPEFIKDEKITLAIQVNGKVRDKVEVGADVREEELKKIIFERENVKKWLEGKTLKKFIYVKGRLVSIVV